MMKQEFERIAKIDVTDADYVGIIEPMYLATNLSKEDFVKTLDLKFFKNRVPAKPKNIKRMLVRNMMGSSMTPNRCYHYIKWVELVDVNLKTGKYIVKDLADVDLDELRRNGKDLHYAYGYDMDYIQCVDTRGRRVKLFDWE